MKKEGSFIVELLPCCDAPENVNSLDKPTVIGQTYWDSKFNYVGLRLPDDSRIPQNNVDATWEDFDFTVEWTQLRFVIDFLMVKDGGMCNKFQSANLIQIPSDLQHFAIYNAFCPQTPKVIWHYTNPK
ncbi:hypothetical protein RFI_10503 [Reticulomyxa filosa]|uniref:Uncharacterized protein n=1 Tax=Reticulomyxa filosa TaxID=46433 RepID=X6NLM2_RETFI|nr:hypothetical protein RFI_10503 [Reticulomyxa filosa]|eukprot:ETO26629.1 hypothetical protein RFI_10503 [Reticulomyxa filosa]